MEGLDLALDGVLTRLAEHRRRRTYLLAFAQNPADFVQALVAAQVGGVSGRGHGAGLDV